MKKISISALLLLLLSFISCEEYLSELPDNRTEINSPEKISELLVNAYPRASFIAFAETMSDNVVKTRLSTQTRENDENYFWLDESTAGMTDSQSNFWVACYNSIAHANKALDAIEKLGNTKELNPQKGEALVARAYAHFMLVGFWSQRYDPATAETALGIPYITKPENILLPAYKRNTVAQVFDQIQKDLEEGLQLLPDHYSQPKFHFTLEAAKAFAARFYLIKGNWDKVLELSKDLGSKPIGKLRDHTAYLPLDATSKLMRYSNSEESTNLLIANPVSRWGRTVRDIKYSLAEPLFGMLLSERANVFNKRWLYTPLSVNNFISVIMPKFYEYFKVTNITSGIGIPYLAQVLFSNDELYLNRIEALVMKGQINEANSELEYFLSTRTQDYDPATDKVTTEIITNRYPFIKEEYSPFYPMTQLQTSYVKAIAETKRREFVQEGMRWFDIKRFNLVIKRQETSTPLATLAKDDKRRALQIPEIAIVRGIEKNPR